MAKSPTNHGREVTFDGQTIVNTNDLLNDPNVKKALETLTKKIKTDRPRARHPRLPVLQGST